MKKRLYAFLKARLLASDQVGGALTNRVPGFFNNSFKKHGVIFSLLSLNYCLKRKQFYRILLNFSEKTKRNRKYNRDKHKVLLTLFARRRSLFLDVLRLATLLLSAQITASTFVYILAQVFFVLPKNRHARFIYFVTTLFKVLIKMNEGICGLKFTISGRIKAKERASTSSIVIGSLPIQKKIAHIDFAKTHVYTRYGVFGFKFWVHFDKQAI